MSSLSRRGFLQRGGILLGFTLAPGGLLTAFDALACGEEGDVDLNAWVHVSNSENTVSVKCPVAEMGQGAYTTIPLLIAEELDADWRTIRVEQAPSERTYGNPDAGLAQRVGGGAPIHGYWRMARLMGAQARAVLINNAARQWGVTAGECGTVPNHVVHARSGRRLGYMEVARLDNLVLDAPRMTENNLKSRAHWRLLGQQVPRLDVPLKVSGRARYGMDVQVPGMLYASILHAPGVGLADLSHSDGSAHGPLSVDDSAALKVEGVTRVVALPHAVAVVGTDYWATVKGKRALKVQWKQGAPGLRYDSESTKAEWSGMAADGARKGRIVGMLGDFESALKGAEQMVSATYVSDHAHHACLEPFNATASMMHDDIEIWSPTQDQSRTRQVVAKVTGLTEDKVRVHTTFLGGGFGAKTEQLANAEAALLSRLMDKTVKVIWSREDDVQHGVYRGLSAQHLQAAIAPQGQVTGWSHRVVADSVRARVDRAAWESDPGADATIAAGMQHPYGIANQRLEFIHQTGGAPVGYWNAVGNGYTVFAVESFFDEIAAKRGKDPLQQRLEMMTDPRGKALLERVRKLSDWGRRRADTALGVAYNHGGRGHGQIVEVVEVSVNRTSGAIKVHNVWAVADLGVALQPRHLQQQIITGIVLGLSAALSERITVTNGVVRQSNFDDYPVVRMDEMPHVHVELIDGGDVPLHGAGKIGVAPMAPAIANAVFRLSGERVRRVPLLPDGVLRV